MHETRAQAGVLGWLLPVKRASSRRPARRAQFVKGSVLNPQMRVGLASRFALRAFALLETFDRRSESEAIVARSRR
jgi:hypothetical protein